MTTTSPEVTGPVEIGLDGKVHLSPSQSAEIAKKRLAEELKQYETQTIVDVYDGRRYEMLVKTSISSLSGQPRMEGWGARDIKKNGTPDLRARSSIIGIKQRKFDGVTPLSSHYNNRFATYDCERERLADAARKILDRAEEELERAKVAPLNLYLEKP